MSVHCAVLCCALLQTLYTALCLPDAVDYAVDALAETVLTPRITDFELEDVKVNKWLL
jgi:predicted Zn-dependent peptidase